MVSETGIGVESNGGDCISAMPAFGFAMRGGIGPRFDPVFGRRGECDGGIHFVKCPATEVVMLNRFDSIVQQVKFGELDGILDQIRKAIRLADHARAEVLLKQVRDRLDREQADYFNLLGALLESQKRRRLAKKCFVKATALSPRHPSALSNLRRREIGQFALGDENQDVWYAQLPGHAGSPIVAKPD